MREWQPHARPRGQHVHHHGDRLPAPLGALDLGWAVDRLGAPLAISLAAAVVGAIALLLAPRVKGLE